MELIDTHCHIQSIGALMGEDHAQKLWHKSSQTMEDIISNANQAGVKTLICVGCDLEDSKLALNLALTRANCYASIGIHPHEAKRYINADEAREDFQSLVTSKKVIAIGECGLDYCYDHSPAIDQAKILRFQLDLALSAKLPVILHVREAFNDFWPIWDSYEGQISAVLHSFTDTISTMHEALARGLYVGVNGIATFAKDPKQRAMYQSIPLDRLLLETDSPYLTPTPYRGTINEPKYILTIAEFLADLRGVGLQQIADTTTANARLLFGL